MMSGSFDGNGLMTTARMVTPICSETSTKKLEMDKSVAVNEDLSYDKTNKDHSLLLDFFP